MDGQSYQKKILQPVVTVHFRDYDIPVITSHGSACIRFQVLFPAVKNCLFILIYFSKEMRSMSGCFWHAKHRKNPGPRGPSFAPRKWSRISRPENGHPEERTNERTPRGHEKCAHFLATKSGAGDPPKKRPRRDKKRRPKNKQRRVDLDHDLDQMTSPPPYISRGGGVRGLDATAGCRSPGQNRAARVSN